ncbi:MAG: protein kinase [Terriglobia bacterium]
MKRLGRYEILEEIGRGAMGAVYRARDPVIGRVVALKVISIPGLNSADEQGYRQRFFREAQAAGQLSHPGIVTIHDVGEDEATKTPYIVMELIEGRTLEELGRSERLPPKRAVELTQQVAEALDYAHGRQVIHRDIKPANILITTEGRAKITDFGVAKLRTAQVTQTGQLVGTPAYMSPEQLTSGQVDGRTDIFALGVILYWLLTGEKPFPGEDPTAVMFKIFYKDPVPPAQVNPSLSSDYDYILGRLLVKDPEQRYQRGRELVDDLEDAKSGRPPRSQATFVPAAPAEETVVTGATRTTTGKTATLMGSPLAGLATAATVALPAPSRKRRWMIPAAVAALLLLLLGASGWWWWSRASGRAQGGQPAGVERASAPGANLPPSRPATTPVPAGEKEDARARRQQEQASTGQRGAGSARGQQQPSASPPPATSKPPRSRRRRRVAMATLRLRGTHNFERATLYVYADGKLLKKLRLKGETFGGSGIRVGMAKISGSIPITAGRHTIGVSIKAPRDDFDQMEHIEGEFERGQTRTLEITLGKVGGIVGIRGLTRNLTLRWRD